MWPREDRTGLDGYEVTAPRRWITYGVLGLVVLLLVGAGIWLHWRNGSLALAHVFEPGTLDFSLSSRLKERAAYKEPPPRDDVKVDTSAAELAKLRAELEALKKARTTPRVQASAPKTIKRPEPFFVTNQRDTPRNTAEGRYALAAGSTKISCIVETEFSSDIDSYFTATVRRPVFDTATGRHLLIPQHSTILGKASGESLVFGNERLPTISLSVSLPNGKSVELGESPVMDARGVTGLVSSVNNHWWRNIGAVFISGVLRGGQQAIQQEMVAGGGAVRVIGGIGQSTDQFGQQKIGKAIDTRPTILVESGELCNVTLIKAIELPEYF